MDLAALSSLCTALDELTERLTSIASADLGPEDEHLASDLFEVERTLQAAGRRLERAMRAAR